ncbi:glycoside hydrolase superfamily [Pilobolus umbonatus]|nr:glycoside hydrolase superfamily [Pilobolus umbonatus]
MVEFTVYNYCPFFPSLYKHRIHARQMNLAPYSFYKLKGLLEFSYKLGKSETKVEYKDKIIHPDYPYSNEIVRVKSTCIRHTSGCILTFHLKTSIDIELIHFRVNYMIDLELQKMLANGFQSWSQTREFNNSNKIPAIRSPIAWYTQLNLQGDYDIFEHTGERGVIHSSSYTHFRDTKNNITFFGSISEQLGYTYFIGDFNDNNLVIYKDVLGKRIEKDQEVELVQIFIGQGIESCLWDEYASFFEEKRIIKGDDKLCHVNGWTSWYNYYGDVSESIIYENLKALQEYKYPIDIFQIDDGFQTAVGDWLSINNKFPSGMEVVANKIKDAGFKAGLWLAPYAVGFTSNIVKAHPDWLILNPETKKPIVAGPNWGGFYALDIYNFNVRKHLKHVFQVVLHIWGFDMVKLDFCFAAAMIPRMGKSRGQIMWEAMDFLREIVGNDRFILGCGVPLVTAFKKVDYCRIGSDVAPFWEDNKLKILHVRERVSTANSLISTLSRWCLSNRMFGNDPDVIILRSRNNKLKPDERYTLCVLNNILGALVFTSDNVSLYDENEHLLYAATFPKVIANVKSVLEYKTDCFVIEFSVEDPSGKYRDYSTYTNMTDDEETVYLPPSSDKTDLLFSTDKSDHTLHGVKEEPKFYHPSSAITLNSHETKTFMHIPVAHGQELNLLGSVSHIIPGAEMTEFQQNVDRSITVCFNHKSSRSHTVYIGIGKYRYQERSPPIECIINGKPAAHKWISIAGVGEGRPASEALIYIAV